MRYVSQKEKKFAPVHISYVNAYYKSQGGNQGRLKTKAGLKRIFQKRLTLARICQQGKSQKEYTVEAFKKLIWVKGSLKRK